MSTAAPASAGIIDIGDPTKMPDHSVSFSDVLSTLNPLQYIPIIGSVYRAITGDAAPQAAQVLGGALLGGPLGLIASAASAIVEQSTGKDAGQHVIAMLLPQGDAPPATPQNQRYAADTSAASTPVAAAPADTAPAHRTADATPAPASAGVATAPDVASSPAQPQPAAAPAGTLAAAPPAMSPPAAAAIGTAAPGPAKPAGAGYTLADYRNFAGSGMPPPPNGNVQRTALVPLQTTIPLPSDVSRTPVVPVAVQTPSNVAPAPAATPAVQPQDTWVSQAMMHGLDRYREMMRQQEQQQPGT
ncbi:MAG TPA: hypothetical protein VMH36_22450 [Alphaproteobacteria bacterium]|nr:hypothetical protein [Alphaproteobacteria bacterium]